MNRVKRVAWGRVVYGVAVLLSAAAAVRAEEAGERREIALTVYNENLGLVRDVRARRVENGRSEIQYRDVAARIDPTSVHLRARGGEGFLVREQNYRFDLAGPETILERYLDHTVQATDKQGEVVEGVLYSHDSAHLVIGSARGGEGGSGGVSIVRREELARIEFPELPEGLVTRPTLSWLVESSRAGQRDLEVEYLTEGIAWHAEYVASVAPASDRLVLSSWVSIDNQSGATYPDAKLKLVAGKIHRVMEPAPIVYGRAKVMELAAADGGFEERAFFEYHLYELQQPTTVRDREIKQIALFAPAEVRCQRGYEFDAERGTGARVILSFKNSKDGGLGLPLPAGKVRVYQEDRDGSAEFAGEDRVEHTPRDEEVRLYVGDAFDIAVEREITEVQRISDRSQEQTVSVKVRNHKTEAVTLKVIEHLYGFWEIRESSHEWRKKDARTVEFTVPAPVDAETVLRYRVRLRS